MSADIRWKQRFESFTKALHLLREPMERDLRELSPLEREGTVQRFEFTLELAWRVVKDFLEDGGLVIVPASPKNVLKEGFAARIIDDGQVWIDMVDHRNLLSHTYDARQFSAAVDAIQQRYLPAIERLHAWFGERIT